MVRLKNLRTDRKKLGLLVSISIILIGVIPMLFLIYLPELKHFYKIEPLALESEDGIYISAFKYTPKGEKNHGGIVVGHGFFGSKLNMQPFSIELVKRGFTVISIDFRGHGASGGYFHRNKLIKDMKAAVDYIEYNLPYITDIGLVGHSLGAEVALEFSRTYPHKINATVAIGGISLNVSDISNLFLATGRFDSGLTKEKILEVLREYTGQENVRIGQLYYGDFIDGNNTRGFISPFSDHLTEVVDSAIIYQTVQWFEQAFNGEKATDIFITATFLLVFSYISLFGVIALNSILVVYIGNLLFRRKISLSGNGLLKDQGDISIKKLIGYYTIYASAIQIIIFFIVSNVFEQIIPLSTTSITLSLIIGAVIGTFIIYNFLLLTGDDKYSIKEFFSKIRKMCSINPGRSILYGCLIALISILSMAAIWHWSVQNTLPTAKGVGRMIMITIMSFPLFLIREFYFRNVQKQLKAVNRFDEYLAMIGIGIFMDNFLIVSIFIVGKINLAYLPPSALFLLAWVIFSIIQNCTATWVYLNSKRNILSSTMFISIFYSWMLVVFFPSYGFL